jgi:thioesterase domain-containing protein
MIVHTKPHPLSCFFASIGYGAYQKVLAGVFQQRRPCLAFTNPKLHWMTVNEQQSLDEL